MRHPHGLRAALANAGAPAEPTDADFKQTVLLLHGDGTNGAQNNTFVGENYQPDQYAVSFDGNGDYLQTQSSSELAFGSSNFTIECWVNVASLASQRTIVDFRPADDNGAYLFWAVTSTGAVNVYVNTGDRITSSTGAIQTNTWYHVAISRSGSSTKLFINGSQVGSTWTDTTNYLIGRPRIGQGNFASFPETMNGYVSNLRVVKGTALYTSNFTVPTAPLTAISGTSLLTCQSATIVDNSSNNFTITANGNAAAIATTTLYPAITRNGNTTQGTFTPFSAEAGKWSNYFDGTGDYLTVPDNAAWDFGTGDFTVECWVNFGSLSTRQSLISTYQTGGSNGWVLQRGDPSDNTKLNFGWGDAELAKSASLSWSVNEWYHIAVSRSGTSLKLFRNGVEVASVTNSTNITGSTVGPSIGALLVSGSYIQNFTGYISNMRVVKGTAVYTSAFTPPTTPLTAITNTSLLTCQDNRFRDASSNNFAITRNGDVRVTPFGPFAPSAAYSASVNGGSGYFDGTGDSISAPTSSAFNMGSGDCTFEAWVYVDSLGAGRTILSCLDSGVNNGYSFGISASGFLLVEAAVGGSGSYQQLLTTANAIKPREWNFVSYTRTSGTSRFFVNGVDTAFSGTLTLNLDTAGSIMRVGTSGYLGGFAFFVGNIGDVRILKGTGGTTSTVPTAPLTAITNTSLLLNFTNAGIIDSTGKNVLETVGNAQIDTTVKKYGTGALEFDGNGDYLQVPDSPNLILSSGVYTIEGWIYPNGNYSDYRTIVAKRIVNSNTAAWQVFLNITNGYLGFYNGTIYLSSTTPTANQWSHFAAVFDGTNINLYLNGTSVLQTAITNSDVNANILVGWSGTLTEFFNGFIDDLRITKGVARYTANFTPPTAPFADK
jgi:hypothetical protein